MTPPNTIAHRRPSKLRNGATTRDSAEKHAVRPDDRGPESDQEIQAMMGFKP
jgi:hypothetical protein